MTDRVATRAEDGIWSRPAAHLGFRLARVSSHHSGVAGCRESVQVGAQDGMQGGSEGDRIRRGHSGRAYRSKVSIKSVRNGGRIRVEGRPVVRRCRRR